LILLKAKLQQVPATSTNCTMDQELADTAAYAPGGRCVCSYEI